MKLRNEINQVYHSQLLQIEYSSIGILSSIVITLNP